MLPSGRGWLGALPKRGGQFVLLVMLGIVFLGLVRWAFADGRTGLETTVALVGAGSGAVLTAALGQAMWHVGRSG